MKDNSRRKFVKQGVIMTVTAGSINTVSMGKASCDPESEKVDVLYRETPEWKRYYETLK